MSGFDMLLNENASAQMIQDALASIFGLSANAVLVLDECPEEKIQSSVRIICLRIPVIGDFSVHLSVDFIGLDVTVDPMLIVRRVARHLGVACFLPGTKDNPYEMIKIFPSGEFCSVFLRASDFEDGEYSLV
jgi:hypothetical protein